MKVIKLISKLKFVTCLLVVLSFTSILVNAASSDTYQTIIKHENGTLKNNEFLEKEFTLDYNSKVKIYFTGESLDYGETFGSYEFELRNEYDEIVFSKTGNSYCDNKKYITEELPKGKYIFILSAKEDDFTNLEYCVSISYLVTENIEVKKITIDSPEIYLCKGDKTKLTATITPNIITDTINWNSSNSKVATISEDGTVEAHNSGEAIITATIDRQKTTCKVTVFSTSDKVYKTLISKQAGTIQEGKYIKKVFSLKAFSKVKISFIGFEDDYTTYGDYKIQIKDSSGKVVYSKRGYSLFEDISLRTPLLPKGKYTFILHAEYDNLDYTYSIAYMTVEDIKIKKVNLNETQLSLEKSKSKNLKATPDPTYVTKATEWSSSNEKVASVNSKGKITAKNLGTAKITAKIGTKKATCKITVSSMSSTIIKKKTSNLSSYIKNIAGYESATWKSSNTQIATVDKTGKATGKNYGSCDIYCTIKGIKYTFKISVKPALSVSSSYVVDTDIYNDAGFKFTNNTNKDITYVTLQIYQYDNRGYKLKKIYDSYYINDTIEAKSGKTYEFWVNDDTKKASCSIIKVWFSDGTTWTP